MLITAMLLGATAGRAAVLDGQELIEALPGESWLQLSPGLELGHATPWVGTGVELWWTTLRLRAPGALHVDLGLQQLRAGPVREHKLVGGLTARGSRTQLGVHFARHVLGIETFPPHAHLRGSVHGSVRIGSLEAGLRWEGPTGDVTDVPSATTAVLLALEASRVRLAVLRRSSRYGLTPVWTGGISLRVSPLRAAMSLRERSLELSLTLDGSRRLGCALTTVLTGARAGGTALALRWRWSP